MDQNTAQPLINAGIPAVSPVPSPSGIGAASPQPAGVLAILLAANQISQTQFDEVRLESVTTGKPAEEILKEKGYVDEEVLARARAAHLNVDYVKPSEVGASPEALSMLDESVAKRYKIFPFALDKVSGTMSVAMVNPLDLTAIEFVEKKSGMRIVPYLASETEIMLAVRERYAQSLSTEGVEGLRDISGPKEKVVDVTELGQVIREAPVAKIVETVLSFAVKARASDVHIEPQENRTRVRYRLDGILHEKLVLPREG